MFKTGCRALLIVPCLLMPDVGVAELRDPTKPPTYEEAKIGKAVVDDVVTAYRLSMTKTGGGADIAMINGKSAKVGDVIDGATVMSIRTGEVELMIGDGIHRIKIQRTAVKRPHRYPERE